MGEPVEQGAIENVIAQLTGRYPSLGGDRVRQVVEEEYARIDGPLREYVPSLVEHAADERLRQEADPVSVAADDPGGPVIVADDASDLDPLEKERRLRGESTGLLLGDMGGGHLE